jgi:peptidoglycan hydrolase-like protein with peptidoglycan-binding domain
VRPIRTGDRGAAVEDVQRRLVSLGVDLGPTGVDGVFLGATCSAVRAFQSDCGLDEDGEVGPLTWAALVDATFTLGDRLLYLRYPYLHGEDVRAAQAALSALGFATGEVDGIFGAFTERAVRDFQSNTAIVADGVVGPETVRALEGLRHSWGGRSVQPPSELRAAPARAASALRGVRVSLVSGPSTGHVAARMANLAVASEPSATFVLTDAPGGGDAGLVVMLTDEAVPGGRVVHAALEQDATSEGLASAVVACVSDGTAVVVLLDDPPTDDHGVQALAARLLDGLCLGLSRSRPAVLP